MSEHYSHQRTFKAKNTPARAAFNPDTDPRFRKVQPPLFDIDDKTFAGLTDKLRSFTSKRDIEDNIIQLDSFLADGKKKAAQLGRDNISLNRKGIDDEVMPKALDPNMTDMFNPVRQGQEETTRVTRQVRDLQRIRDDYARSLAPMEKETRDQIFQEIITSDIDEMAAKYGNDTIKEVVESYTYDEAKERRTAVMGRVSAATELTDEHFSFENIEANFAKGMPEFKHMTEAEAGRFMMNLNANPDYQKADYKGKEAILKQMLSSFTPFFSTLPKPASAAKTDPSDLNASLDTLNASKKVIDEALRGSDEKDEIDKLTEGARAELLQYALIHKYYYKDPHGNWQMTVGGAKKQTDFIEPLIRDHLLKVQSLQGARNVLAEKVVSGSPMYQPRMQEESPSAAAFSRQMAREVESAQAVLAHIRKIRKTPETKQESGFWGQMGYTSTYDLMTLGFGELKESFDIYGVTEKAKRGETLTFAEEQMLASAAVLGHVESQGTLSRFARVGRHMTPMLPYIATFGATSGVYTGVRGLTKAALGSTTRGLLGRTVYKRTAMVAGKQVVTRMGLYEAAATNLSRVTGAAAQTLANPQYIANNTIRRMQDNLHWYVDPESMKMVTAIDENSGENFGKALWKGSAEAFAEMFTERAGGIIMSHIPGLTKAQGALGAGITKAADNLGFKNIAKLRLLNSFMKQQGFADTKKFVNSISKKQFGWDGVVEEYLEEFTNSWVGLVTGDMNLSDFATKDYWSEQLDTLLTVAAFGGLAGSVRIGAEMSIGSRVKIPVTGFKQDKDGIRITSEDVSFPKWMWNGLAETMTEHGVDQEAFTEFIETHGKDMTAEQRRGAMQITMNHQQRAMAAEAAELQEESDKKKEGKKEKKGEEDHRIEVIENPSETTKEEDTSEPPPPPLTTSVDPQIKLKKAEHKTKIKEIREEQAKDSLIVKRLQEKEKRTEEDNKKLAEAKKQVALKEEQATKETKRYEKENATLRNLAEKERAVLVEKEEAKQSKLTAADQKREARINHINTEIAKLTEKVADPNISFKRKQQFNRQIANLEGQRGNIHSMHQKAVNEAYGLPENATQSEVESMRNNLTPEERKEVEDFNREIEKNFPDLVKYELLDKDPHTGQYAEPTPEYLQGMHKRVSAAAKQLEDSPRNFPMYNERNEQINANETLTHLLDAKDVLEARLRVLGLTDDIKWDDMLPSEKWNQLAAELAANPNLTAEIEYMTQGAFRIKLSDGRTIKGYYKQDTAENEQAKADVDYDKEIAKIQTEWREKINAIKGEHAKKAGDVRYTREGKKVTLISSNRDKYNRGSDVFDVDGKDVRGDYRQAPTSGNQVTEAAYASHLESPVEINNEYSAKIAELKELKEGKRTTGFEQSIDTKEVSRNKDADRHNRLLGLVIEYNKIPKAHNRKRTNAQKGINNIVQELGYTLKHSSSGRLQVIGTDGKPAKTIATRYSFTPKVITDYNKSFQKFINDFMAMPEFLIGHPMGGLSNAQKDQAVKNIKEGKPSVAATTFLDALEQIWEQGGMDLNKDGMRHFFSIDEMFKKETPGKAKQREKVMQAVKNPSTRVGFDYQTQAEWNPDGNIANTRTGEIYGDRIMVKLQDGTEVGSIEIDDAFARKGLVEQRQKVSQKAKEVVMTLKELWNGSDAQKLGIMPTDKTPEVIRLRKEFVELVNEVIELFNVAVEDFIEILKHHINDSSGTKEYKDFMNSMIELNHGQIVAHVKRKRDEKDRGLKAQKSKFKAGDLVVPSMNAPHQSAEAKVQAHLRAYAVLWSDIAATVGVSRERVESEFIRMAHEGRWSEVKNEAGLPLFLQNQRTELNDIRNSVVDKLGTLPFSQLVSLFNFYENVRVITNYALRVDADGFEMRNLAAGISYEEFVQKTMSTLDKFEYTYRDNKGTENKVQKGFPSVQARILDHARDAKKRQGQLAIMLKADPKNKQQRIDLKLKQHKEDVRLLEALTGIEAKVWNDYFVPATKENEAHENIKSEPDSKKKVFRTYMDQLRADTWNIVKDKFTGGTKRYPKIQSDLVFNLGTKAGKPNFVELITEFFIEGSEASNVFSNLYKLSTSLSSPSEFALSGVDVKGDRFSMLSQMNMVFKMAEEILEDPRSNSVVDFYKSQGRPMQVVMLNGMFGNKKQKGLDAENMSLTDIMLASLSLFSEGVDGKYLGSLGQFGDKGALYFADLPKAEMPTQGQVEKVKELFPDYDKAVDWMFRDVMLSSSAKLKQAVEGYEGKGNQKLQNLATHFIYNYAINNSAALEFLNGDMGQYDNSLVAMVKRAGSANSPGYRMNTNIEGGIGKSYTSLILSDKIINKLKLKEELADGLILMSGEMAARMAVSQGSIYAKLDEYGGMLSSSKILSSFIDKGSNSRALLKGNWVNVDMLAQIMPGSVYAEIAALMKSDKNNPVDVVAFASAAKLNEDGVQVAGGLTTEGKLGGMKLDASKIVTRATDNLFVQQDLRHDAKPVPTKQASQFISNILVLPRASGIVSALADAKSKQVQEFIKKFDKAGVKGRAALIYKTKMDWLTESLDEVSDKEIIELLESGATLHEPGIQGLIRSRIASAATRQALDLNVMRAATQEIPDIDNQLQGFRLSSDKKHYLLPECAVSDPTARPENKQFEGDIEGALAHVKENKNMYPDLFDQEGEIMDWEIRDNNGRIPGEPQMLTRTPADHPHSHTIARVKFILPGNFTMLDSDSRIRSGSDFDGDARYNTSFFKDKDGVAIFDPATPKGTANIVLYNLMLDYIDPANNEYIRSAIDTDAYDEIAKLYTGGRMTDPADIRSFYYSRNDNMVGVKLKGILTDVNTMFSILSNAQAGFKKMESISVGGKLYPLKGFINDHFGAMKIHIVNLQNMAFDNAKNPRLEAMGMNEHTVLMYMTALMTNKNLDSHKFRSFDEHHKAIYNAIAEVSAHFNSPEFLRFTELRREAASQSNDRANKEVMAQLKREFPHSKMPTFEQNFADGQGGRKMQPKFKGKSTMDLILSGDRTRTTRSQSEIDRIMEEAGVESPKDLVGETVLMTDKKGRQVLTEITGVHKFTPEYQNKTWQKEGWEKSVTDAHLGSYPYAVEFEVSEAASGTLSGGISTKEIAKLNSMANSLKEIVTFLKLTREVPSDIVSFMTAKEVYKSIHKGRNIKEDGLFDTRAFFDKNGKLLPLFASAEKVMQLGEKVIYSDAIELGHTGSQILDKIWSALKAEEPLLHRYHNDHLSSLSRSLANIITITAIDPGMTFLNLQESVVSRLTELRAEFPGNTFLNTIQRTVKTKTGASELQISFDLRRARLSDTMTEKIRNDFDLLPELDKKHMYAYAVQRYGSSTSTMNGSYMNHIGLKFRAEISKAITRKVGDLATAGKMSPVEKAFTTQWMLKASKIAVLRPLAHTHGNYAEILDPLAVPFARLGNVWTLKELQDIAASTSKSEVTAIISTKPGTVIKEGSIEVYGEKYDTFKEFRDVMAKGLAKVLERSEKAYPSNRDNTSNDVKDMMSEDALQEPFALEDQALQDFILKNLLQEYPGVQFFTDRQAFYDFVERNGGRLLDVSTIAIGHAFQNAVFIDPLKARQSTTIHEFSHVYWDAMADTTPIKNKLREFYKKNDPSPEYESQDELDERIIYDLGVLGTDRADIHFRGTLYARFLDMVRQFWAEVKNLLGAASEKDLMYIVTDHIWNNHREIGSTNIGGNVMVRNMIISPHKIDKVKDKSNHYYKVGGHQVSNVTGLVGSTGQKFVAETEANKKAQREAIKTLSVLDNIEKRGKVQDALEETLRVKFQAKFEAASGRGTAAHAVAENVFVNTPIEKETKDFFYNKTGMDRYKAQLRELKNTILAVYPDATFKAETIVASAEYGVAGTVDLIVDIGNNKLIVIDFKSTEKDYVDNDLDINTEYTSRFGVRSDIAQAVPLSHQGDHGLQLHIYREILENQKDENGNTNEVVGMYIVPVKVAMTQDNKILSATIPTGKPRLIPRNELEKKANELSRFNDKVKNNIGWIYFDPANPTFRKVSHTLMLRNKKVSDIDGKKMKALRRKMSVMGFDSHVTDEMVNAYAYLSSSMGDLAGIKASDISMLRNTGMAHFRSQLFDLGYDNEAILGLSSEELFYATTHGIRQEDLGRYFADFTIRTKIHSEKDPSVTPGYYRINVKDGLENKEGASRIVSDAGTANVKVGDRITRYYAVMEDGNPRNMFFEYTVIRINKTKGRIEVENDEGNRTTIYGVGPRGGVLAMHDKAPEKVEIREKFNAMYYHVEETVTEKHFIGTSDGTVYRSEKQFLENTSLGAKEWGHYRASLMKTWDFFDKYDSYTKLYDLLEDQVALQTVYEEFRGAHIDTSENLKNFLMNARFDHFTAEAIREENKFGPVGFMPTTMQFYYMVTLNASTIFKDFEPGSGGAGWTKWMFPDFLSGKHVPLNFLYSTVAKAYRDVTTKQYDANKLLEDYDKYIKENIEELTVDVDDKRFWVLPSETEDKKGRAFLQQLYGMHQEFDLDFIERRKMSHRARVEIGVSRITKSEAMQRGGKLGKELYELTQEQPYDNVRVNMQRKSSMGLGWENVLDEKGRPITRTFKEIREDYAKRILSGKDTDNAFGNRLQRRLSRSGIVGDRFINTGSRYHKYRTDAKNIYRESLSGSTSHKVMRLPTVRKGSKVFGSQHTAEGHFAHLGKMISDNYMKDVLSPYDYVKQQYTPSEKGKDHFILKYIKSQIDTAVFDYKDEFAETSSFRHFSTWLVRWTSLVYMGYSVKTQAFNMGIGHLQNMVYEPGAYFTGLDRLSGMTKLFGAKRLFDRDNLSAEDFKNTWQKYRKAKNILDRYGLANMVDETQFEKLDKFFTHSAAFSADNIINKGYLLLEWAEKSIQIPIFVGMMTEQEWNSYDDKGKPINEQGMLTEQRADEITRRVGYIHGFYSKMQASPIAQTPGGALLFQFKKFVPSLMYKLFGNYRYDRNYIMRSGIAQSLITISRIIAFTGFTGKEKKLARIAKALASHDNKDVQELPFQIKGMNDYFDTFISKLESDPSMLAALKQLPANERRNLVSALIQVGVLAGISMITAAMGDDDDPRLHWTTKSMIALGGRITGDIMLVTELANIEDMSESPAAGIGMLINALRVMGLITMTSVLAANEYIVNPLLAIDSKWNPFFGSELKETSALTHYQQDGEYYQRGKRKLWYQLGNVTPFGSMLKMLYRIAYGTYLDQLEITFPEMQQDGTWAEKPVPIKATGKNMTHGQMVKLAKQGAWFNHLVAELKVYESMNEGGDLTLEHFLLIREHGKRMSSQESKVDAAMEYESVIRLHAEGNPKIIELMEMVDSDRDEVKRTEERLGTLSTEKLKRQIEEHKQRQINEKATPNFK